MKGGARGNGRREMEGSRRETERMQNDANAWLTIFEKKKMAWKEAARSRVEAHRREEAMKEGYE